MTDLKQSTSTQNKTNPVAYWGTIILSAVLLLVFAGVLLLTIIAVSAIPDSDSATTSTFIAFEVAIVMAVIVIMSLASLIFTIRGNQALGYRLAYLSIAAFVLNTSTLVGGQALSMSFLLVILSTFGVGWLSPSRSRRFYIAATLIILALVWVIEWINPPWQADYSGTQLGPIGTVIFVIIFSGLVVRQSWGIITYSISNRLTALVLVVTIPLLIGITAYISNRAGNEIETQALHKLEQNNKSLATNVSTWLELHVRTTKELATLPDITSMDAGRQKPTLQIIASAHPNLFLVHTTDLNGMNVARNDDAEPNDYHDRAWFLGAKRGAPITYEALISRTIGKPALNIAAPIYNEAGKLAGVASIVSELSEISREVIGSEEGQSITYIVDAKNRVVAHPDPSYTEGELRDLSTYPPVAALNEGKTGQITFTDETGITWVAYVDRLDNSWGIVAQQPEAELLAPVRQFQTVSILLILIGSGVMFALAWFAVRRSLQPLGTLTTTVSAIAAGDLSQVAEVKSQDEIGVLASTFNDMTSQLRELIGSLEGRVAARTKDLATVAEVGTATATILDTNQLLQAVVELTKERFNLYHSHIYLLDETGENLVLTAGAGEPGRIMAAERRSIPLDREQSLVARAARERKGVTVNDVTQEPDFLPNPLLPDTRSELAVPMIAGGNVIGVFDIQSDQVGHFTDSDISVQTTLAAQVSTSIQNVRSFEESKARADLESLVNTIGQRIQQTTSVEDTLQTAIREIGLALGATRVSANIQASRENITVSEN